MKNLPSWILSCLLLLGSSACIYVRATGDVDDLFSEAGGDDDTSGFHELSHALEGCLTDPAYDLALVASPWRKEAEWTVRYRTEGSDEHAAFRRAKDAVLARIAREGGTITEQTEEGPHAWTCSFRMDDEPCEASVRLEEDAGDDAERPHQLEVSWEEAD